MSETSLELQQDLVSGTCRLGFSWSYRFDFPELITPVGMKQLFIPGASRKNEENSITIKCMHGLFLNSEHVSHRWNSWWSEPGWAWAGCWCDSPSTPAAESRSGCRRGVWVIRLLMSAATPPKNKATGGGGVNECVSTWLMCGKARFVKPPDKRTPCDLSKSSIFTRTGSVSTLPTVSCLL